MDLFYLSLQDPGPPMRLTDTPHNEFSPRISPDGRYVAYRSNAPGQFEVYMARFPSGDSKIQVSVEGGILTAET